MTYQNENDVSETFGESKQRVEVGNVMRPAITYARVRVDHLTAALDKQTKLRAERSGVPNVLIKACDVLAAAMKAEHEDVLWGKRLGQDRKDIGDFDCDVHCILGIAST